MIGFQGVFHAASQAQTTSPRVTLRSTLGKRNEPNSYILMEGHSERAKPSNGVRR